MQDSTVKFVLVDEHSAPTLREVISKLEWSVKMLSFKEEEGVTSVNELMRDDGSAFPEHVDINPREDVIVIISTSGSTGPPKGAMHTHYTGVAVMDLLSGYPNDPSGSYMSASPNYVLAHFVALTLHVVIGTTNYLIGNWKEHDYVQMIHKYKPTSVLMLTFMAVNFSRYKDLEKMDFSFLKLINISGWTLDVATSQLLTKRLPHVSFAQGYVMTETVFVALTSLCPRRGDNKSQAIPIIHYKGEKYTSTGLLLPYVSAKIVDPETGRTLPRGERGDIRVKSPTNMIGYIQRGSKLPDRKDFDKEGWFCTGDIGFLDNTDNLVVIDRLNFSYKYKLEVVFPTEIESVLQEHEAVHSAGVVGIPGFEVNCSSRAFVVLRPGHHVTADELQTYVASRLPEHKHLPGGVRFIDSLPCTAAGKLDRRKLKEIAMKLN